MSPPRAPRARRKRTRDVHYPPNPQDPCRTMNPLFLIGFATNQLWYALPLIVVVSLVYAATRHEQIGPILSHAVRIGTWIVAFMVVVFLILLVASWWV